MSNQHYLERIRVHIDRLKARTTQPPYSKPRKKQDKIRLYFVQRASQHGEVALRIADIRTPLFILGRVLCEDFFLMYWVAASAQNATRYEKTAVTEWAKLVKINLMNKRARVVHKGTRKDATAK